MQFPNWRHVPFLFLIGSFLLPPCFAKTFLITCATSELGEAVALSLAKEKHSLLLAGRNSSNLSKIASHIQKTHSVDVKTAELDFETSEQVERGAGSLTSLLKGTQLDGVVLIGPRPSFTTPEIPFAEEWTKNLQVGFIGPLQVIRHLRTALQNPSSIVVLSGITSKYFIPEYPNTNVIRIMWSAEIKNLAVQLASHGTRVNAVSPGIILTRHNQQLLEGRAKSSGISVNQQLQTETAAIPLRRYGESNEVAEAVKFLLSEKSSFINGVNLSLDGGQNPTY